MSDKEPRKISDVMLELDRKVDLMLKLLQSQDMTNKILSNKLSEVISRLDSLAVLEAKIQPQFTVETTQTAPNFTSTIKQQMQQEPDRFIPISAEDTVLIDHQPESSSSRRTSRPENSIGKLEGDDAYLIKPPKKEPSAKYPIQIPKGDKAEVIVPNQIALTKISTQPQAIVSKETSRSSSTNVSQRVVDRNGKSLFLANINIIDHETQASIFETRTSAVGKWAAPLPIGNYRVSIKKREPLTHKEIEAFQDIKVDGSVARQELPNFMIKDI